MKNPGDYRTRWVAGRPVIFCLDHNGQIRALINSCRHRGAVVCREREGNARNFYCMYHGWTYNTDGSLRGVPDEASYAVRTRHVPTAWANAGQRCLTLRRFGRLCPPCGSTSYTGVLNFLYKSCTATSAWLFSGTSIGSPLSADKSAAR